VVGAAVSAWGVIWVFGRVWGAGGVDAAADAHGVTTWPFVVVAIVGVAGLVLACGALAARDGAVSGLD
jgi:hypothetical protein